MSRRALIVDDESVVREVFRIHLERWDYEVSTAANAIEGANAAAQEPFDLVIADSQLPDGCGLDVVVAARRRVARAVAVITAEQWPDRERRRVERLGAITLYKPCDWELLRAAIEEHAGRPNVAEAGTGESGGG
jgi:two-component system OmpR family response regulator